MLKEAASLIMKHTVTTRRHLTPELVLRLITPECPLWRATEEQIPFKDPFWAFYWPGGQATASYVAVRGPVRATLKEPSDHHRWGPVGLNPDPELRIT
uniref:SFRICE_034037 n=1 Tax=Spodoptera frugiperda TaxID=7108 RepID=A0A2H1WVT4_SPOFR